MSADDTLISDVATVYAGDCVTFATTTILMYDTLLTCDEGINLLQRRRISVLSVLFVANRLIPLASYVSQLVLQNPVDDKACTFFIYLENISAVLLPIISAVFLSFRTYALSGRLWIVAILVFALGIFSGAPVYYLLQNMHIENYPAPGSCIQVLDLYKMNLTLYNNLLSSSFATYVVAECLAAILVGYKTHRSLSTWYSSVTHTRNIVSVLIRNGMLCFVIPLSITVISFALQRQSSGNEFLLRAGQNLDYMRDPFTCVLVSRFLLDLGNLDTSRDMTADDDSIPLTTRISAGAGPSTASVVPPAETASADSETQGRASAGAPASRSDAPSNGLLLLVQMA